MGYSGKFVGYRCKSVGYRGKSVGYRRMPWNAQYEVSGTVYSTLGASRSALRILTALPLTRIPKSRYNTIINVNNISKMSVSTIIQYKRSAATATATTTVRQPPAPSSNQSPRHKLMSFHINHLPENMGSANVKELLNTIFTPLQEK